MLPLAYFIMYMYNHFICVPKLQFVSIVFAIKKDIAAISRNINLELFS